VREWIPGVPRVDNSRVTLFPARSRVSGEHFPNL